MHIFYLAGLSAYYQTPPIIFSGIHNRASHTFLDNKVSKQLFLPEWMHAISTLPIIIHSGFLLLPTHSHYRVLASCISISPWQPKVHWDRKRLGGDWSLPHGCLSKITPDPQTDSRGQLDEAGRWKVNGAVSHAPRPESQRFKQSQPGTSRLKPNSHWLDCRGTPDAPASPEAQSPGSTLMAVCPQLA